MPNPSGKNGHNNGTSMSFIPIHSLPNFWLFAEPTDDVLKAHLLKYREQAQSQEQKCRSLTVDLGYSIRWVRQSTLLIVNILTHITDYYYCNTGLGSWTRKRIDLGLGANVDSNPQKKWLSKLLSQKLRVTLVGEMGQIIFKITFDTNIIYMLDGELI